jgi:Zn-dependent peptidase ImmA (M78 family)/DNA-binding XRE family transcriptional regulator
MFNGTRLTVARQRRLLTKKELATKIGVEPRAITGYEAGEYLPSDENIDVISRILRYPNEFFFGEDLDIPDESGVSFRSMSKMSAKRRDAAIAAAAIAFTLSAMVEQKFNLPALDLLDLREESPEFAAVSLRQHWGLGELPVKNMIHLLEAKGIRVFSLAEDCVEVDAYSLWRDRRPFVFLNTLKSAEHRRWDAAHELAHLVLHRHGAPNGIDAEKDANAFAAAFLMPTTSMKAMGRINPTLETLMAIKKKWTVSVVSVAVRAYSLGLISDWHYRHLCIEISRRGWRTAEPFPAKNETSQMWQKILAALRSINTSFQDFTRTLHVPADELVKFVFGLATIGLPASGAIGSSQSRKKPNLRLVVA